jgi:heptosyltransferase-1
MSPSPRILIIRLSSLGDILHALPAFTDLRTTFPDAQMDWLVASPFRFLLSAIPGIDTLYDIDTGSLMPFSGNRSARLQLWKTIRNLRARRYDFSIDFQGLLKTAFLSFLSGSRTRMGFSKDLVREPPAYWFYHKALSKPERQVHVLTLNRMLAELAGARPSPACCEPIVTDADRRKVDSLISLNQLEDFVVMNPGGGWRTKKWDPERYGVLAKRIRTELGLPVVVTTGPGEEALYRTIAEQSSNAVHHFPISFLQLIPLLKKARLFIAGDTGPFHLASSLGTPVVGIFGPTSPVRNGPWRDGDEAVSHKLPCSYCYGRTCPTNNECMDISVDEVFSAVIRRLGNQGDFPLARL